MFKRITIDLPAGLRHVMDPKFLFVLFIVEIGTIIFNSFHMAAPELHVYSAINEMPVIYQVSGKAYSCFSSISYCVYEQKQLIFLKILYLVFLSIIVLCYGCLFTIIIRHWQEVKIRPNLKITWYTLLEFIVLFTLALRTLLIIILFERDNVNTDQCNRQNRLIRAENIFNYFVLSIIEIAYIAFDLVNRQFTPFDTTQQDFEYGGEAVEHLRSPTLEKDHRIPRTWNQ